MRGKDFLGGVVIGALVGAVVGLLVAPQSGEETRGEISERARELGDKVKESSRHLAESSRDLLEQSKSQVSQVMQTGREKVESLLPKKNEESGSEA